MAGVNTAGSSGTLTTSLPTVYSRFMLLEQERGKVVNTATREKLLPHTGSAYNYINYGRFVASSATDGVDAAQAQTLQDAKTAFSPGEVVVNAIVSDRTIARVADPKLLSEIGDMAMNAIELKEDQDGCAKFSSFTPTVCSAGTVPTVGHLLASEAVLRIGNSMTTPEPAPLPWFGTIHPNALAATAVRLIPLTTSTTTTLPTSAGVLGVAAAGGAPGYGDKGLDILAGKGLLRQLDLGELLIVADANVSIASNGTDSTGGIYSKRGLVFVEEVAPYMKQERDESLRGIEITCVTSYAWGVYRPGAYGVNFTSDSTTPTS